VNGLSSALVVAPSKLATFCEAALLQFDALAPLEELARNNALATLPLIQSEDWQEFCGTVRAAFQTHDYVVIKGLPACPDGAMLILAAQSIGSAFRTYRGGQIVKNFTMSPWTTELSHTTKEGEFHTDLNTEPVPPAITAMQCLHPDPGAPVFGVSRVARLTNLMEFLGQSKDDDTLNFLTRHRVTMLNDHSSSSWSGHVVEGDVIRYHPETLRAAMRRQDQMEPDTNQLMARVAKAALAVSDSFVLERGDILLLSNYRTLHYRGECSVAFRRFPSEFDSRSVFVLHMGKELTD
jgi:hypothetical protein